MWDIWSPQDACLHLGMTSKSSLRWSCFLGNEQVGKCQGLKRNQGKSSEDYESTDCGRPPRLMEWTCSRHLQLLIDQESYVSHLAQVKQNQRIINCTKHLLNVCCARGTWEPKMKRRTLSLSKRLLQPVVISDTDTYNHTWWHPPYRRNTCKGLWQHTSPAVNYVSGKNRGNMRKVRERQYLSSELKGKWHLGLNKQANHFMSALFSIHTNKVKIDS